jgi:inositol transport system ATP-binding protein
MDYLLQMKGVFKSFDSVKVLQDVNFSLEKGEVHALMGENGAGKSTLMKILAGLYTFDRGQILLNGQETAYKTPQQALEGGIAMIYQELNPIDDMTVAENIFLGREPVSGFLQIINRKKLTQMTLDLFEEAGIATIDPNRYMRDLSIAEKQLIEIIKAVSCHVSIIIMDEPTSSLSVKETEILFSIIKRLKEKQVSIVYISHRMDEIFKICDRITVMRDGRFIVTGKNSLFTNESLIKHMVGRPLGELFPARQRHKESTEVLLEVNNLTRNGKFNGISFKLYKGEILGLAGLAGAGRTEILETLFGMNKADSGQILIKGQEVNLNSPAKAIANKLAFITEDRKQQGIYPDASVNDNMTISCLKNLSYAREIINKGKEKEVVTESISKLNIKTSSRNKRIGLLSGGNQQKVILGRWLLNNPSIIFLDEPTRGVDIGAKQEIYKLITMLAESGKSIILASSEISEVIGLCDRTLILCNGKLIVTLNRSEITQEKILKAAMSFDEKAIEPKAGKYLLLNNEI